MTDRPASLVGETVLLGLLDLARTRPVGAFVEVGVFQGGSAWHLHELALRQGRQVYLCDTFRGMPHRGSNDPHPCGDFAATSAEAVRAVCPRAVLVEGVFPESAAGIDLGLIAFVHLDVDQEKSYGDALEYFRERVVDDGVIWLDDYGCLPGATIAVDWFAEKYGLRLTRSACGKSYFQF
jgi:hypothetical protein